jgi:hypothetical protein
MWVSCEADVKQQAACQGTTARRWRIASYSEIGDHSKPAKTTGIQTEAGVNPAVAAIYPKSDPLN